MEDNHPSCIPLLNKKEDQLKFDDISSILSLNEIGNLENKSLIKRPTNRKFRILN
jgi:hypothetical protein